MVIHYWILLLKMLWTIRLGFFPPKWWEQMHPAQLDNCRGSLCPARPRRSRLDLSAASSSLSLGSGRRVLFTRCATGVEGAACKALWAKCKPGAADGGTRSPFLGPRADTAQKGPHLIVTHGQSSCYIFMFASNSYQAPPYVNDQFHFFVFILFFF